MIAAADTPAPIPAWIGGVLTPVDKLDAHHRGLRHKAVSVFVMHGGALLLQRRALGKYHTPGLWANTCCTHPEPGEGVVAAGARRLDEELGFTCDLVDVGTFTYTATDPSSGLVERELDHVLVGRSDGPVDPDPAEVSETRWISVDDLRTEMAEHPDTFTPWLAEALEVAAPFLPFPQANVEVSPDAAIAEPEPEPDAEIDGDLDLADHAGSS